MDSALALKWIYKWSFYPLWGGFDRFKEQQSHGRRFYSRLLAWTRWPGNFPDDPKTFQRMWKLLRWPGFFFRLSGNFLDHLEIFQMIWKLSTLCENFPGRLETFQIIWKLSKLSEKLSRHFLEMTVMQWRVDFIVTRKNIPDAQKHSANQAFLPLAGQCASLCLLLLRGGGIAYSRSKCGWY